MKYHRKTQQRRGSDDERENDETLRGMVRNQKKIIKRLEQRIRYLQKQLNLTDSMIDMATEEDAHATSKEVSRKLCKKCESTDIKQVQISKPGGELNFWVCQTCHHREKIGQK